MSYLTNTINVIYNRILNEIGPSGKLYGIKYVRIGEVETQRFANDLPIIVIDLVSSEENPAMPNIQLRDSFRMSITLICKKLEGENTLFNGTDGILDWHSKILNVIDLNASGVPDVTFDGNVQSATQRGYDKIESLDGVYSLSLFFNLQTREYFLGGR